MNQRVFSESIKQLDRLLEEHENLDVYGNIVNLHITDENFPDRLKLSYSEIENWKNTNLI